MGLCPKLLFLLIVVSQNVILSVKTRLLPDKLLISNNLSVKPHLFTDKLVILSQLFTVIGSWWRAGQPRTAKKLNSHADSTKLVKPSRRIARQLRPASDDALLDGLFGAEEEQDKTQEHKQQVERLGTEIFLVKDDGAENEGNEDAAAPYH